MAPRVFLHIGLPKTGTSVIQRTFAMNSETLASAGFYYPKSGRHSLFNDTGHHLLAIRFMLDRWDELALRLERERVLEAWPQLISEIDAISASDASCIISSEWFCFDVHEEKLIEQIARKLHRFDPHIVIVLRDVVDFINSVYAQRVRDGYPGSIVEYIRLAWPHLNWKATVNRWERVFGKSRTIVLRFEDLIEQDDFFDAFFIAALGGHVPAQIAPRRPESINRRSSRAATELMREVSLSDLPGPEKRTLRDQIRSISLSLPKQYPASLFSNDLAELLRLCCEWPEVRQVEHSAGQYRQEQDETSYRMEKG